MTIESEEFYNLMQTYRFSPEYDQEYVCKSYQDVIAHVDSELAAIRVKLEEAEKADRVTVDAIAWDAFIKEYDDYNEGKPSVSFHELRESLAIVIESAAISKGKTE